MTHIPVLINEILAGFEVFKDKKNLIYLDGTFGRGGHYQQINKLIPDLTTIAFDQDPQAIEFANKNFSLETQSGKLKIYHDNYFNFSKHFNQNYDFGLLDLGVSSPQIDQPDRGFSFYHDGPLDMRMNSTAELSATEVINQYSESELISIFQNLGEIYKPQRVVKAIVNDRKTKPFTRTKELSGLIERVDGWRRKGYHPATQYFMALRLVVNRELDVLQEALPELLKKLNPGGRLAVISFHSLEDRIVKNIFKSNEELGKSLFKKVIQPQREEEVANPRSRSSKLRIFERSGH